MSLILDALKRAESERESIRETAVMPAPPSAPPPSRSRRTWAFGALAAAVFVGVVVMAMRPPSPAAVKAVTASAEPTVAKTQPPAVAPLTPIPGSEDVTSLDDLTEPEAPSDSVAEPVAPAAAPVPASAPAPTPMIAAPAAEPAPVSQPPPVAQTSRTLKPLREMPSSYRAEFPALAIQVHSYDKDAAARFVRIGGYRYKEGETLAEGPRLLEIVGNGLVLEYRGERVIYPLD